MNLKMTLSALMILLMTNLGDWSVNAQNTECEALVERAMAAGIIEFDGIKGRTMAILVDHQFWTGADFRTRRGMAKAIDCAIAGEGNHLERLDLISTLTGDLLGRMERGTFSLQ
ncbi:hypothetical protein [Limibacillus sp. MBR-115]|jgi:hypothetical protein|uniref:hypothetical protein n=1 Tax=Limibacillus sp. MBR-115 TaxID=3156465 RepID=UPI003391F11F